LRVCELHSRDEESTLPPMVEIRRFRRSLLHWFGKRGRTFPWRSPTVSLYKLIVTEVLLQRTTAATVAAFYEPFFERYPSWVALASARESQLRLDLRPIGLWKRRAAVLSSLARMMTARRGRFPRLRANIEALPGVGQYVANAISLFAHAQPAPLLDSNMARVLERYFGPRRLADIRYDPYLQTLAHQVITVPESRALNWAILDLASLVCRRRKPLCPTCPVRAHCRGHLHAPNDGRQA
jgi:A/G-specific adenine glycosylase